VNVEEWTYRKRTLISFDFALFFLIIVRSPAEISFGSFRLGVLTHDALSVA